MSTQIPPDPLPYGPVTADMVSHLRKTGPWVRFIGVLCFISAGLLILVGLASMLLGNVMFAEMAQQGGPNGAVFGVIFGVVYLVLSLLYLVWGFQINGYASGIARMKRAPDVLSLTRAMTDALDAQRRFWRLVGVIALVTLCAYAAIFVIAIIVGVIAGVAGAK